MHLNKGVKIGLVIWHTTSILGKINIITIEKNIANVPNNLLGIARNIAKNGKKYHSGTICFGVIKILAGI